MELGREVGISFEALPAVNTGDRNKNVAPSISFPDRIEGLVDANAKVEEDCVSGKMGQFAKREHD